MLRTAALMLLSIGSPALAQNAPPCTTSVPSQFVTRLADLPEDIRKSVLSNGRVADAGEPYFNVDSLAVDGLKNGLAPVQRLVLAGHSDDKWFVWLEHGFNPGHHYHVLGFRASGGDPARNEWYRAANFVHEPCAATNAFLAGVVGPYDQPRPRAPLAYRAPGTNVLIDVESDRRHVTAIGPDGKILWQADPFADGKLDLYRHEHPVITYIGAPPALFEGETEAVVNIGYSSSQAGLLSIKDGSFTFLGQD